MSKRNQQTRATVDTLRSVAEQGRPERALERVALADALERIARVEAQLTDFLARADVLLSQSSARR